MGTNASDLSALAGARAGMVGATLRTRRQEIELQPLETGTSGGATAYLKVEKSRFLFLEGSAGAAVRSSCPSQRSQMLPRCSPAPSRCALPLPRTARRRALPRPPRAPAPLPLRWLLVRGARDSTSQGGPPHLSPLLPPPLLTTSSPELPGERVRAAHAAGTLRPAAPGTPAAGFSSPSCVPPALAPVAARREQPLKLGAWAGQTARRPRSPSAKNDC
jgi:hypothetical protein